MRKKPLREDSYEVRRLKNPEQKLAIAKFAARLVQKQRYNRRGYRHRYGVLCK